MSPLPSPLLEASTRRNVLLAATAIRVLLCSKPSVGQIPRMLSYQGILTDTLGSPKADGMYTFTFRLYDASSGGSALWTEAKTLQTKSGLFSILHGDQVVIPMSLKFTKPYWLGVQIAAQPELSPRVLLATGGYSKHSASAAGASANFAERGQRFINSVRSYFSIRTQSISFIAIAS